MAEQPPIPFPQQNPVERLLANLTTALRSHTNALLEVKASLAVIAERLDHLVDAERTEADDIREIRRTIVDAHNAARDALHAAENAKTAAEHISGEHAAIEHRKTGALEAVGVLVERLRGLPVWLRLLAGTSVGGAIVEAVHRFFGHGRH